ncbi:dihydroxy-acid dehydratase [Gordonia aquimaris]|uniref:Dihydroxy-acid dehydratase n=1 Tax=Gordonia aquimaris TaxID=2984863 RepID=A0A9X3D1D8_9ACTN|nr:dihydroxy-acid dehydratase [Gordonia aquimaris]MCX2963233.1 dihydroxy-acid dehydratase [Gordonia aquimaris]
MPQESVSQTTGELFSAKGFDGFLARAFMTAEGFSPEAVGQRPVIGIANSWSELTPCNAGLRELAAAVKRGVIAAGGFPLEFPTISLSEPYIRPSSLYLRNLMAMDVEEMITSSPIDGVVLLGGCDKTVPAQLMGAYSANRPSLTIAAGPRALGRWGDRELTTDDIWSLSDDHRAGLLSDEDWSCVETCLNDSVGTCNVMGTATTMAIVAEALGMALPGSALLPATSARRRAAAEKTGRQIVERARAGLTPSQVVTREAIWNAIRVTAACGGSTNALLHLAALAGRVGEPLDTGELRECLRGVPLITDVRPAGDYHLSDLDAVGGAPAVIAELGDLFDTTQLAGTDRPWSEIIVHGAPVRTSGAIRSSVSSARTAGLAVVAGTLAPDGAVVKCAGADERLLRHCGPAVVFDGVEDLHDRIDDPNLEVTADSVLVLRGVGPVGGPGMPEVGAIPIPKTLVQAGVRDMVRISDARMSGTSSGTMILHACPEAAVGGPLALVRDGDAVELDVHAGRLDLLVDEHELEARRARLSQAKAPSRGFERLHHEHVLQASEGCDFDFLRSGARV